MIAFLGLGHMGAPMARRLVDAGHPVAAWNRTPKEQATAGSVAAAVGGADLVITMLSDPAAVEEVLREAAPALKPGATVVEMSTIGPKAVDRLRALLPDEVALIDAPVLGSVQPATDGTLTILAGGDVSGCREVLSVFGRIVEAGPLGAGAALKLAVMSAIVPAQVMLAENLAYAEALGVDRATFLDVLSGTPLGGLVERVRPAVEKGPYETRYALGLAWKDLRLATEGPGAVQTVTAAARERLAGAADRSADDLSAIFDVPLGVSRESGKARHAQRLNPSTIPPTNGRYSHAVRAGNLLFVAGQVAIDDRGEVIAPGDMARQSEVVYDYLDKILADQGCTFEDVTHIRTFVTDIDKLPEHSPARSRHIAGEPPASTTVEVPRLFRPGLVVEVDLVAVIQG